VLDGKGLRDLLWSSLESSFWYQTLLQSSCEAALWQIHEYPTSCLFMRSGCEVKGSFYIFFECVLRDCFVILEAKDLRCQLCIEDDTMDEDVKEKVWQGEAHLRSCYRAGTTFCVYSHFRQQILTLINSNTCHFAELVYFFSAIFSR